MMKIIALALALYAGVSFAGTAGQVDPQATAADVCKPGFAKQHRKVTQATERAVYARDGFKKNTGVCANNGCVLDHDISLELGGNNSRDNLKVQLRADSLAKDKIENYLHAEVCKGKLPLADAQYLVKNWRYLRGP
jgi:hypothetical protein